ncbi:hypothetical protein CLOM_g6283, partial [Closterium sp. NIES-68]
MLRFLGKKALEHGAKQRSSRPYSTSHGRGWNPITRGCSAQVAPEVAVAEPGHLLDPSHVRQKASDLVASGAFRRPISGSAARQQEQAARKAGGFEGSIYLHHSDVGRQVNSAALSVGLIHALQVLRPGVGYFRPIDQTSHGGNRVDLMKKVFHIKTPPEDMFALTQDQAYSLLAADKIDDLLEAVISAYERHKRYHDFVVIEGTSMRDGSNTSPINGLIASALESPALLLTDCIAASHHHPKHHEAGGNFEAWDFEKEATSCILDHARIMKQSSVDIAGALLYRMPRTSRGTSRLREKITEAGIPFLGALPADKSLESFQ